MNKTTFKLSVIAIFLTVAVAGCYYDKGELVYPRTNTTPVVCDTAVSRYSVEVKGILQTNCYGCHGGTASSGKGIVLDTYNGVRAMALNNRLVRAITHTGPANTHMPQGGSKLPECSIALIRTWARNGAQNN